MTPTLSRAVKSTNGRANVPIDWGRLRFQALGWVAPETAQIRALERFHAPSPPLPVSRRAADLFARADRFTVTMNKTIGDDRETSKLSVALWGRGPAIYLLHGWGGRGSQWLAFVEPLVAAGHTVVVLDAPLHGESTGTRTSVPHFAAALDAVIDSTGPAHAVIAHSLGGVATSVALGRGLHTNAVVLVGTPADPSDFFRDFMARIGLPSHLNDRIRTKFEESYGCAWNELTVRAPSRSSALPALIVHDQDDREVSFASAHLIARAWPSSVMLETKGLGHQKVLRAPTVIERAVAFASRSGE